MRRIIAAIVCLLISAGICTAQYCYVEYSTKKFISGIEEIEREMKRSNKESALLKSKQLCHSWDNTVKVTDMLLYHDYIYSIGTDIATLKSYIERDEDAEFFATCERVKHQLRILFDNEKPTAENII